MGFAQKIPRGIDLALRPRVRGSHGSLAFERLDGVPPMGGYRCVHPEAPKSLSGVDCAPSPCCSTAWPRWRWRDTSAWIAGRCVAGAPATTAPAGPGWARSRRRGRPPKLDARRRARLERVLLRGAEAAGFSTPLRTCPRFANIVRREFGVRYHVDHIGRVLRTLLRGQDPQGRQACRPAPRAADAAGVRHQPQDSPGPGTDDPPVGPHQGGSRDRVVDDRREDATSTST